MGKQARVALWIMLLLLVALDVVALIANTTGVWVPTGDPASPHVLVHLLHDGNVVLYHCDPEGGISRVQHVDVGSALRGLPVLWVIAGLGGLGLFAFVVSGTIARRGHLSTPLEQPRLTISRGMVVIGAVSVWLWLSRTEMFWILCGTLVLFLALVAESRRIRLMHEIKNSAAGATVWMRLAIAGYWVAVFLTVWWIVCVIVWDSLRPDRQR